MALLEFRTAGYNPYAVKYSPYVDSRVGVAASANFGIVGNGRVYVLGLGARGGIAAEAVFDTNDALFDLAWSEINERQLAVACGDGSVRLFDSAVPEFPVMSFSEHKREAFSVAWGPVTKDALASSSWDGTVKIWSPTRSHSLRTLPVQSCAYSVCFSPSNPAILSAVSSDGQIRVFDLRAPASAHYHLVAVIPVGGAGSGPSQPPIPQHQQQLPAPADTGPPPPPSGEILTHDWNKYRDSIVATGGVDGVLRTFDVRNPRGGPLAVMSGHAYAVRRLGWSPHAPDVLLSASYDMTVRLWSDGSSGQTPAQTRARTLPGGGAQLGVMNLHTEFVTGVDWCLFGTGGWVASAGWDERVLLWDATALAAAAGRRP